MLNFSNGTTLATVGRTDRYHLKVREIHSDSIIVALIDGHGVLKAAAAIGAEEGTYMVHRIDGYCRTGEKLNPREKIMALLSIDRFYKLLHKASRNH